MRLSFFSWRRVVVAWLALQLRLEQRLELVVHRHPVEQLEHELRAEVVVRQVEDAAVAVVVATVGSAALTRSTSSGRSGPTRNELQHADL